MKFKKINDAVCIENSKCFSTFFSESTRNHYQVRNDSISEKVIPPENRETDGRVKIGVQVKLVEFTYTTGTCCFVDDPSRSGKVKMEAEISFGEEGKTLEFKSSLHHACDPRIDSEEGNAPVQYRILAEELCAFGNARDSGELVIGVKDDGKLTENGLNLEVSDTKKEESKLRNYFSQVISATFTSRLIFKWERPSGKLILRILSPVWEGDVLLVSGTDLFVRSGSNCQRVKGADLIHFIRSTHAVMA